MKAKNRCRENPVQDLLNAVVVRAAEDYRAVAARLIKHPRSRAAIREREEIRSFFLSEDFTVYTDVKGEYLMKKLEDEEKEIRKMISRRGVIGVHLDELWVRFRIGDGENPDQLKETLSLVKEIRKMEEAAPKEYKHLFRLTAQEKKMIREFRRWEKEHVR